MLLRNCHSVTSGLHQFLLTDRHNVRLGFWKSSITKALDHCQRATHEISQSISQFTVNTSDESVRGKIAVLTKGHFSQEKISERVDTEIIDHGIWIDDIPTALGHLFAIDCPPAMCVDRCRKRQLQSH